MPGSLTRRSDWITESDCDLAAFRAQVLRDTDPADYPSAIDVRRNVPVYAAEAIADGDRQALQTELIRALGSGPGVVVFEGAVAHAELDAPPRRSRTSSPSSGRAGGTAGDHFGKAGANDRIWNAAQKLALHSPEIYAQYYAADALAVVAQAWLDRATS
jgi:hypothetical protein